MKVIAMRCGGRPSPTRSAGCSGRAGERGPGGGGRAPGRRRRARRAARAGRMTEAGCAPSARRLFFALWPDATLRSNAAECVAALVPSGGGRPQRPDQLHVTLVFLGQVSEERLDDVRAVAVEVTGNPFT